MGMTPNQLIERAERALRRAKRDQDICRLYLSGRTLQEIGEQFGLRKQRIKQIVKQQHVWRPQHRMKVGLKDGLVVSEDRDEFLGVTLSEANKRALREEAARRGMSMSALTSDLIKDMLDGRESNEQS